MYGTGGSPRGVPRNVKCIAFWGYFPAFLLHSFSYLPLPSPTLSSLLRSLPFTMSSPFFHSLAHRFRLMFSAEYRQLWSIITFKCFQKGHRPTIINGHVALDKGWVHWMLHIVLTDPSCGGHSSCWRTCYVFVFLCVFILVSVVLPLCLSSVSIITS